MNHLLKRGLLLLAQFDFSLRVAQLRLQLTHFCARGRQLLLAPGLPLRKPQQRRFLHTHTRIYSYVHLFMTPLDETSE